MTRSSCGAIYDRDVNVARNIRAAARRTLSGSAGRRSVGGKLRFVEPKTSTSVRVVVVPKLAVRHLAQHRARQDAERLARGAAWRDHDLVFASSRGTPIEPRNVNRRWDELRDRAGLGWLRLHDLRHGCATFMMAAGVPARTIMEVLGHSEIGVTMNTYTHVLAQLREDATDAIDRVLGA